MTDLHVIDGERLEFAAPRIRLIPFDQIKLGTTRRDLVRGVIPRVGLTIVWGPPKSGKSFWTFDVAMHVALGRNYRDRRVHAGAVVYCAFEGQSGLETRVEAFRQRFLAEEFEPVPFYLEPVTLDLVGDQAELVAVIRRQLAEAPVAVVLDTLNRSLRGSESSDEDMTAYIRAADAIREAFECAVIVVHHCGIDGSRPRGHTALTGAADAQIAVKRDAADNIAVTVELAKDGPQGDVILSRLEVVEVGLDDDGETISSCVVVPVEGQPVVKARPAKLVRLNQWATIALTALTYITDHTDTEPAPPLDGVPASARAVQTADVRAWALKTGFADKDDKPGTIRMRWQRAKADLIAAGKAREHGELLWLS